MNLGIAKALNKVTVSIGLVVSMLWGTNLFANTNASISLGVEQTDPLTILKLPDIRFEHPLSTVTVPEIVANTASTTNSAAVVIPTEKKKPKSNQRDELLTMNDELANEQVSADLLAKFNRALTATSASDSIPDKKEEESYNAVPIADLPDHLRAQIPDINYSAHVYSSKSKNRSVRLNSRDLREGSWLSDNVEVLEILQNEVIMRVGAQSFSLKALSDWSS